MRYTGGKLRTPFKMAMVELNKNSKKKSDLQTYLQTSLQMHITGHETIAQLQKMAIKKIYQCTSPEHADPVGFGEHCSLSYQEVLATQPRYCEWVLKTASEGQCDYRLDRLAQWVKLQWEVRPARLFGTTNADQGVLQGDTSRPAFQGEGQGCEGARGDPEDPSFTRIRSHVRRQCEQFSDGTAATDGGDLGDPQGGCGIT